MSKSIHVSRSEQDAPRSSLAFHIEDKVLDRLGEHILSRSQDFPQLQKIVMDPYGDFVIQNDELDQLTTELMRIQPNAFDQIDEYEVYICLRILQTLSSASREYNLTLYGFGD